MLSAISHERDSLRYVLTHGESSSDIGNSPRYQTMLLQLDSVNRIAHDFSLVPSSREAYSEFQDQVARLRTSAEAVRRLPDPNLLVDSIRTVTRALAIERRARVALVTATPVPQYAVDLEAGLRHVEDAGTKRYALLAAGMAVLRAEREQRFAPSVSTEQIDRAAATCGEPGSIRGNLFGRVWQDRVVPGKDVTDLRGAMVALIMIGQSTPRVGDFDVTHIQETSWFEFRNLPDTGHFSLSFIDGRAGQSPVPLMDDFGDLRESTSRCIDARNSGRPVPLLRP
jgi:hypothetical protein